jgi:hypothetical protein
VGLTKRDKEQRASRGSLVCQVWRAFEPYLICLIVDFLISVSLWLCFFVFLWLTKKLAIPGWEGTIILAVHGINMALAFAPFGVLFTLDVIAIRRRTHAFGS